MLKQGKSGKKKKVKKLEANPIQAFDLDSISLADLRKYVTKLEKELALMRKDCAFFSLNKEKIMNFLMTMREVYATQKKASVVKNSQIDDLIEQLRRFPETYNEKAIISDKERARKKLEKMFKDFVERNTTEMDHIDEEYALKQQIFDMDKRLQRFQYFHETAAIDRKELFRDAQDILDNKYGKMLERALQDYVKESLETYQDFDADKVKMLISVWNTKDQPIEVMECFTNEIRSMQNFFHEISSNNSEVIKMLKEKLENLSTEEKKIRLNLKQTHQENMKLQEVRLPGFYDHHNGNNNTEEPEQATSNNMKDIRMEKKLQKLQFKNDVLKEQLRIEKKCWEELKKRFISATRVIYQKVDFKAYMLEEIIKKKLLLKSVGSESEEPEPVVLTGMQTEEKTGDETDGANIFSMRVEDSDTLFVPPIYHEFWDPNLRKLVKGK